MVKYAEQKSEQILNAGNNSSKRIKNPWEICPNCHQPYQNYLAIELVTKFVSIAESNSSNLKAKMIHIGALCIKLKKFGYVGLPNLESDWRTECKQSAKKALSVVEDVRGNNSLNQPAGKLVLCLEGRANRLLGQLCILEGTEQSSKAAVEFFEKSLDAGKELGDQYIIETAKDCLAELRSGVNKSPQYDLEFLQDRYDDHCKRYGEGSVYSIKCAADIARSLHYIDRTIEAQRLLIKLADKSRRVHNPKHKTTNHAEIYLQQCKTRLVCIMYQCKAQKFQVLRYDGGEERLVVKGPVTNLQANDGDKTLSIATKDILGLVSGTPVICHGLKKAQYLNGKIGDVRGVDKKRGRYEVYFEDTTLKPNSCRVKLENLKILFELPGTESP